MKNKLEYIQIALQSIILVILLIGFASCKEELVKTEKPVIESTESADAELADIELKTEVIKETDAKK